MRKAFDVLVSLERWSVQKGGALPPSEVRKKVAATLTIPELESLVQSRKIHLGDENHSSNRNEIRLSGTSSSFCNADDFLSALDTGVGWEGEDRISLYTRKSKGKNGKLVLTQLICDMQDVAAKALRNKMQGLLAGDELPIEINGTQKPVDFRLVATTIISADSIENETFSDCPHHLELLLSRIPNMKKEAKEAILKMNVFGTKASRAERDPLENFAYTTVVRAAYQVLQAWIELARGELGGGDSEDSASSRLPNGPSEDEKRTHFVETMDVFSQGWRLPYPAGLLISLFRDQIMRTGTRVLLEDDEESEDSLVVVFGEKKGSPWSLKPAAPFMEKREQLKKLLLVAAGSVDSLDSEPDYPRRVLLHLWKGICDWEPLESRKSPKYHQEGGSTTSSSITVVQRLFARHGWDSESRNNDESSDDDDFPYAEQCAAFRAAGAFAAQGDDAKIDCILEESRELFSSDKRERIKDTYSSMFADHLHDFLRSPEPVPGAVTPPVALLPLKEGTPVGPDDCLAASEDDIVGLWKFFNNDKLRALGFLSYLLTSKCTEAIRQEFAVHLEELAARVGEPQRQLRAAKNPAGETEEMKKGSLTKPEPQSRAGECVFGTEVYRYELMWSECDLRASPSPVLRFTVEMKKMESKQLIGKAYSGKLFFNKDICPHLGLEVMTAL